MAPSHPKEACFLAGLPVGAVGELDHTDIPLAGNVRPVEFTARGTGAHPNYRPGVDSTRTVDSRLTAAPPTLIIHADPQFHDRLDFGS
jgi:hypothetical protein